MTDNDGSRSNLEEGTRDANTNLQRLIEAIGGLLVASGDLLMRVQGILGGAQPAGGGTKAGDERASSPPAERGEE